MKKFNKKAQSERDFSSIILVLFGLGFIFIIASFIGINLITNFMAQFPALAILQESEQKFIDAYGVFDNLFVFIMIALLIGIGITSYKLATSKVFFLISFILAGLYGMVAYFFSYMFGQIASQPILSTVTLIFPNTILVCTNLHWVSLAMIIISSITLYAKRDGGVDTFT